MAWEDNYSKLVEIMHPINDNKEWRLVLEEHKTKGTLHVNIRAFQTEGAYTGPTKNGMNFAVNSIEELEQFQVALNQFFAKAKEML
ncbi:MAG: hypothetical protein K0R18_60 [Bacillales bacterium]|jgi:hypothetical protein|nr:hypothetical protein [Bacillales bacterium]